MLSLIAIVEGTYSGPMPNEGRSIREASSSSLLVGESGVLSRSGHATGAWGGGLALLAIVVCVLAEYLLGGHPVWDTSAP